MKKYIYIMVLGLMISACTHSEKKPTIISVLEDDTELDFIAKPTTESITSLYSFKTDLWQSATFRYGRINSLTHNQREETSIKAAQMLLGNELERQQLVADFKADIHVILNKPKDSTIYRQSSIWLPLIKELKYLQEYTNHSATLYLFSDLRENTNWYSTYQASDLKKLQNNPKEVIELFLNKAKEVQASPNITVVVVFQPRTVEQDILFEQLQELYTKLFLQLGIQIEFITNLKNSSNE